MGIPSPQQATPPWFTPFQLTACLFRRGQVVLRAVLETLSGILMLNVHLPLADGRELVLPRYTQPEPEQRLVLEKLGK